MIKFTVTSKELDENRIEVRAEGAIRGRGRDLGEEIISLLTALRKELDDELIATALAKWIDSDPEFAIALVAKLIKYTETEHDLSNK